MCKRKCSCSAKDSITIHLKANVICKITCPGCNEDHVGKTDRNLVTRLNEHVSREDEPINQHLSRCGHFVHIFYLIRLPDIHDSTTEISNNRHFSILLRLMFVFWAPVVTFPNCYF